MREDLAVRIRPATLDDAAGIHALLGQIDRYHADLLPEQFRYAPQGTENWRQLELMLEAPDAEILLAFDTYSLVGLVFIKKERSPDLPIFQSREWAYLDILTVDEGQRGRGIGRQLLAAARNWAEESGLQEIQLTVYDQNPARDTYRHWGFAPWQETLRLRW